MINTDWVVFPELLIITLSYCLPPILFLINPHVVGLALGPPSGKCMNCVGTQRLLTSIQAGHIHETPVSSQVFQPFEYCIQGFALLPHFRELDSIQKFQDFWHIPNKFATDEFREQATLEIKPYLFGLFWVKKLRLLTLFLGHADKLGELLHIFDQHHTQQLG